MSTKRYIVAVTATAALALTACGSDTDTDSSDTQTSETSSQSAESSDETSATDEETSAEEPSESSSEEESSESETDGDDAAAKGKDKLTKPGTELGLGDTATVPQGDDGAALTVTVTKIEKGKFKDLSMLENSEKYKEYTPVYVHYEMTGTNSSKDLANDILEDVDPVLTTGQKAPTLSIVSTSPFKKCELNSVPEDFGPGDTEQTCDVAMIKDGMKVGGAQYSDYDTDYEEDGRIVWMK
ncbi:hypothetical protein [Janibacter corallicola]|uniref:hypothetical protein n=1 Tax=Janibacter corallicola TaxID=415212 RepID=UPI00082A6AE9|nr:hypothetical protein [Janibacter corallicola]